jgi:hypothetical protein
LARGRRHALEFVERSADDRCPIRRIFEPAALVLDAAISDPLPAETWREAGTIPWFGPGYSLNDLVVYQMYGHKREHDPQLGAVIEQHD